MLPTTIILVLFSYLIGSISTGVVLSRLFGKGNLQKEGSKNIGATNVSRLMGKKWGILTLLGDALKGMIPIWVAWRIIGEGGEATALVTCFIAFAVFFGHLFPIFLGFKGGKGVATALGIYILLAPKALLVAIPIFLFTVILGKYVSLGSIITAATFPILLILFNYNNYYVVLALFIGVAVIIKHRENIKRLMQGEEKPWNSKK
jgi:acyl phosphate:glycerol-3-phosphate acyltransferase